MPAVPAQTKGRGRGGVTLQRDETSCAHQWLGAGSRPPPSLVGGRWREAGRAAGAIKAVKPRHRARSHERREPACVEDGAGRWSAAQVIGSAGEAAEVIALPWLALGVGSGGGHS